MLMGEAQQAFITLHKVIPPSDLGWLEPLYATCQLQLVTFPQVQVLVPK